MAGIAIAGTALAGYGFVAPGAGNGDSGGGGTGGFRRTDEPPYQITVPDCVDRALEYDPRERCVNIPAEPWLDFDQVATTGWVLRKDGSTLDPEQTDPQF